MWQFTEVRAFIETNQRNPSKHRLEEHDILNWFKANRKRMNAGKLEGNRVEKFKNLLVLIDENKHVNQWK